MLHWKIDIRIAILFCVTVALLGLVAIAEGQRPTLAECTWERIGTYWGGWAWFPGQRYYLPIGASDVDAILQRANPDNPATAYYGEPGWYDDRWILSDGTPIRTHTEDYTAFIVVNSRVSIAIYQNRVIAVGFLDDENPSAPWHALCGAYEYVEDHYDR